MKFSDRDKKLFGALGVAAVLAYLWKSSDAEGAALRGAPPSPELLLRFARSPSRHTYTRADTMPAGYKLVPLLASSAYTPITPNPTRVKWYQGPRDHMVRALRAVKEAFRAIGEPDIDPRLVLNLWAIESGWGTSIHYHNISNIKSVLAKANPDMILGALGRPPAVWIPEDSLAGGIYMLEDSVRSFDGYPAFSSLERHCRHFVKLMNRRSYGRAMEGLRMGGDAGLVMFATALSEGRYSPANASDRIAAHRYAMRVQRAAVERAGVSWDSLR